MIFKTVCLQIVLFLGVTILLASTYVTLYSQDKAQSGLDDSVVKIAVPNDREDIGEDADVKQELVDSNSDLKKDGIKLVINYSYNI